VKKYSNGKVKRTLKKGLKVLEMVKREWNKIILIEKKLFEYSFHSNLKKKKKKIFNKLKFFFFLSFLNKL